MLTDNIGRKAALLGTLAFLASASLWVSSSVKPLTLWLANDMVISIAWNRDGTLIATSSDFDRLITVWSSDGRRINEIRRSTGSCGGQWGPLAFTPDGRLLYTALQPRAPSPKAAFSVLDWQAGQWIKDIPALQLPAESTVVGSRFCAHDFRISPDDRSVLYMFENSDFALRSLENDEGLHASIEGFATDFQWNPNQREVAFIDIVGVLKIRSMPDFATVLSIRPFKQGSKIAYSSDGRLIAAGGAKTGNDDPQGVARFGAVLYPRASVVVVDRQAGNAVRSYEIASLPGNFGVTGLAFLPNNDLIVATPKKIYVRSHAESAEFVELYNCVNLCNFTIRPAPDGRILAIGDQDRVVLLDLNPVR